MKLSDILKKTKKSRGLLRTKIKRFRKGNNPKDERDENPIYGDGTGHEY